MSTACWCSISLDLPSPLDRHGLRPGIAGDSAQDRPARAADDPGRAPGRTGGVPARSCSRAWVSKNIEVYAHKLGPDYPGQVGGVISRAVGPIPETLDRVARACAPGGRMIFMKGPECDRADRRGRETHAGRFAWRPIMHMRFPARTTAGGSSCTSGWKARSTASNPDDRHAMRAGDTAFGGADPGDHERLEPDISALS